MSSLKHQLEGFIEDLTTIEASIVDDLDAVAYSHIEYEGDTLNWLATHQAQDVDHIIALQKAQLDVSSDCRSALLTLTTSIVKSLL